MNKPERRSLLPLAALNLGAVGLAIPGNPLIFLLAPPLLVGIAASLLSPIAFPLILTFTSHIANVDPIPVGIMRAAKWAFVGALFVIFLWQHWLRSDRLPFTLGYVEKYFLVLLTWSGICLLFAAVPLSTAAEMARLFTFFLVYFAVRESITTSAHVRWLLLAITVTTFAVSIIALAPLAQGHYVRLRGFFDNANGLGVFLNLTFPVVIVARAILKTRWERALIAATALLVAIAVLLSWSRGSIGAFGVQVILLLILEKRYLLLKWLGALFIAAVVTVLAVPSFFGVFYTLARLQGGTTHRTVIWKAGLESIMNDPIFGKGYEVPVEQVVGRVYWDDPSAAMVFRHTESRYHAHNHYIHAAVTLGVPGLLILLWWIVTLLKQNVRSLKTARSPGRRALAIGMICLVGGATFTAFFETMPLIGSGSFANYFWIALGMVHAIDRRDIDLGDPRPAETAAA